ncbi:MAG: protein kinase [Gammaproteobacteria bacterium]|nr:protein kinase [Gammaproteobacteria bacterium]
MQPIRHEQRSEQTNLNKLQASLDDHLSNRLSFDELRMQWITSLAGNPEMRGGALRLLYNPPLGERLADVKILSLKRIVETAIDDDPEDWTVEMAGQESTAASPVLASRKSGKARGPADIVKANPAEDLAPGRVLMDRFVLEEPLGRGGSGVVYRARDRLRQRSNAVTNEIALKVLGGNFCADAQRLDPLQHEALLTQGLSHPNIVRVYDFHRDGETRFLTMELLEGHLLRSLFARIQPSVVSKDRAVKIIEGMCLGLAYAHSKGFVHADFKPGNVFLTAEDEPKILDFGLAHFTKPKAQTGDTPSPSNGMTLRATTPAYASCNRLEGGDPAFSDDVYSLSCVIYELLAGRHPYQRKSATEARKLGLKPVRIDGLTDVQWRTLLAGLRFSSSDGATQVHDILTAFRAPSTTKPARVPATKRKGRSWTLTATAAGFVIGAGLVLAMTLLGIKPIDARYVELARESRFGQFLQSTFGYPKDETGPSEVISSPGTSPGVETLTSALVVESELAPAAQEAETGTSESELSLLVPEAADLGESAAVDVGGTDIGRANEWIAVQGADDDLSVDVASTESAEEVLPAAATAGVTSFQLGSAVYSIGENGQALPVEIYRQGNLAIPASVELTTYAGSAESAVDFMDFDRYDIRFAVGEASKTVFIPIVADALPERSEAFRIALSNSLGEDMLTEGSTATVVIIDDDT